MIIIPPNTTLLRLAVNNPKKFYRQEWYLDEEFANKDIGGKWLLDTAKLLPAAVWAYAHVTGYPWLCYQYAWTCDTDEKGDRVYVGRAEYTGFQVHRHLTLHDNYFINRLED